MRIHIIMEILSSFSPGIVSLLNLEFRPLLNIALKKQHIRSTLLYWLHGSYKNFIHNKDTTRISMCVHYQERTGAYNVLISPIWSNKTEPFSNVAQRFILGLYSLFIPYISRCMSKTCLHSVNTRGIGFQIKTHD